MRTRLVIVGDVHSTADDVDDCSKLDSVVLDVLRNEQPDYLVFLGDAYDQFALKNVVVERWWMERLHQYAQLCKGIYLIVGNHDRPGDSSISAHALQAHATVATVVDQPTIIPNGESGILALPFFFRADDFVAACANHADNQTVLCHQSFLGGKYESGLPVDCRHDASAVDAIALPQKCVIAGHIHTPQSFGKVLYPGSPRWRNNVSDANLDRFVYAVDFEGGLPKSMRKYATGDVCRRIWKVDDIEGGAVVDTLPGKVGDRYVVDITGTSAYIESRKSYWARPGVRLRTHQTDRAGPKLSEAAGITAAWVQWESVYMPKFGTGTNVLQTMARERLTL